MAKSQLSSPSPQPQTHKSPIPPDPIPTQFETQINPKGTGADTKIL